MATQDERDGLRAIRVNGVRRQSTGPSGEIDTEYAPRSEIKATEHDLALEDLAAAGKRPVRTILTQTSKGIC